jgi:hypothetical protein
MVEAPIEGSQNMVVVDVSRDFTRFPSGRFKKNGTTSGEGFRERFLEAPIRDGNTVEINLDGTVGYGSSFLEEAFGGLVRKLQLDADKVLALLHIHSNDPSLVDEIVQYVKDADAERKR